MKSRILWSVLLVAGFAALPSSVQAQKISDQELAQAQTQRMKAGLGLRAMEKKALDDDPKVIQAKENLDKAQKDWSALQSQVDEAVKGDPDYQKAQTDMKTAEDKLTAARKALADASTSARKAREAEEKSRAQSASSSYGGGGSSGQSTYAPQQPKVNPLASQQKTVKDAQDEVNKIRISMNQLKLKTEKTLEAKDEWKAAKTAVDKAKADYDAACRPVLAALKEKPEFKAMLKQEAEAQAKIDLANGITR
jgi:chromosome segregation ATPase